LAAFHFRYLDLSADAFQGARDLLDTRENDAYRHRNGALSETDHRTPLSGAEYITPSLAASASNTVRTTILALHRSINELVQLYPQLGLEAEEVRVSLEDASLRLEQLAAEVGRDDTLIERTSGMGRPTEPPPPRMPRARSSVLNYWIARGMRRLRRFRGV
jgi:hypothetical protein